MRIVFGHNHFKIKSYSPVELGIGKENESQIRIERRQKYFHFFWIPFFGIGKMWAVRKEGTLYELPISYENHLRSLELRIKTPWYTYAGPLLILAGFLLYWVSEKIEDHRSYVYAVESFEKELTDLSKQLAAPSNTDYYQFDEIKQSSENAYLKVADYNDTAVRFQLQRTKPEGYSPSPIEIAACFSESPDSFDFIWINKKQLDKYIIKKYEPYSSTFEGVPLPNYNKANKYKLEKILHLESGNFTDQGIGNIYNKHLSITLMNSGLSTTITEIKAISGDIAWNDPLPIEIETNQKFSIHGKYTVNIPSYKVELICKDKIQNTVKYLIEGKGIDRTLTKEEK